MGLCGNRSVRSAQSIQDRSLFEYQTEIEDVNGNVVGFRARRGHLSPNLAGRVPFQFSAPAFVPGSCVKRLLIQIAIADICAARPPLLDPQKVNLWIPDNGSRLDSTVTPSAVQVDRDLPMGRYRNPLRARSQGR